MASIKVIDADFHINSPPDLWQKRVAAKYREAMLCGNAAKAYGL